MAEQQLVDYLKKARQSGQKDDQSRTLLSKNGWTDSEINDAFSDLQTAQPQQQPNPQFQAQPQAQMQPKVQPDYSLPQDTQPLETNQTEYKPMQPAAGKSSAKPEKMPGERRGSHVFVSIIIVLIILAILGGAGYFLFTQNILGNPLSYFSAPVVAPVQKSVKTAVSSPSPLPSPTVMATSKTLTVPQNFDGSKITVGAFSKTGSKMAYCAQDSKTNKISCYLNDQILSNNYNYKPYWIGFSPDESRVDFLYIDPATKQAFTYENGKEGSRYDGTIVSPKFSDDSKNFSFVVNDSKTSKSFAVLNGKEFSPHDKIYGIPALTSDGKYLVYGARDGQDFSWVADSVK